MKKTTTVLAALFALVTAGRAHAQCFLLPTDMGSEQVCALNVFPDNPIVVELGEAAPLPGVRLVNDTDRSMTFTIEWVGLGAPAWGPLIIHQVTLDPRTESTLDLQIQTHDLLQVGSNPVAIAWTAEGGDFVISLPRPDYELLGLPPPELAELIQVPVRFCVLDNSPLAGGTSPGGLVEGRRLAEWLQGATVPWLDQASILFRPAFAPNGIPVIRDPETFSGQVGDIDVSTTAESKFALSECESQWADHYPSQRGLIVNSARDLIGDNALAVAAGPPNQLRVDQGGLTGRRGDDLCGHPRNLTVSDVSEQFTVVVDPKSFRPGNRDLLLAHELGHNLLLLHGNGLDDDSDGLEPPADGQRRFDVHCDPLGASTISPFRPVEDHNAGAVSDSLMRPDPISDTLLRPLQIEQGREVAKLYPGALFADGIDPAGALVRRQPLCGVGEPGCGLPEELSLMRAQVAIAPRTEVTSISHKVFGPLGPDANVRYASFLDLDANSGTGCDPVDLGFPTAFAGVELVSELQLTPGAELPTAAGRVWSCQSDGWQSESTSDVIAYNQTEAELGGSLFAILSLRLDPALLGGSTLMRMQAIAEGENGLVDRLPVSDPAVGETIELEPPPLPQCEVNRPIVPPGGTTVLSTGGFAAHSQLVVLIHGEEVARDAADASGNLNLDIPIPAGADGGLAPITVLNSGGSASSACALIVEGDPVTPATVGSLSPAPSRAGWNDGNVSVSLVATPAANPIAEIHYSATGAESIPATTAQGDTATVDLSIEGTTVLSFFAIDSAGVAEGPQLADVRIDVTAPTISGSASPSPNGFGWNNADVTVSFSCSDAPSGLWFCTGPTVLGEDGADQSVTGEAEDLAMNTTSATVDGIDIDKTAPTVTYTNNAGSYGILEQVDLQCTAFDALSGVLSTTCMDVIGPAYEFVPGTNTVSAQATDRADNVGYGSASFEVAATFDDLCVLSRQFIALTNPNPPKAMRLGKSLCAKLEDAEAFDAAGKLKQKRQKIADFIKQLASNTPNFFTEAQRETLTLWAHTL